MILSRTPLRITLGGGGTDLPSYYENYGPGFCVSLAISKYIYVSMSENFEPAFFIQYSEIENVGEIREIANPIVREAFALSDIKPGVQLSTQAEVPAGTGLGSSGAFAVAVLGAAAGFERRFRSRRDLAEDAFTIERSRLGEPVGKQDQYATSLGGLNGLEFLPNGDVVSHPVPVSREMYEELSRNLLLFFTGISRSASDELRELESMSSSISTPVLSSLEEAKESGRRSYELLSSGELAGLGNEFELQWNAKFRRSPSETHQRLNSVLQEAKNHGSLGGKLVGAGGGGFLLMHSANKDTLAAFMESLGYPHVPFEPDFHGFRFLH